VKHYLSVFEQIVGDLEEVKKPVGQELCSSLSPKKDNESPMSTTSATASVKADERTEADVMASVERLVASGEWGEAEAEVLNLLDAAGEPDRQRELWARLQSQSVIQDVLCRSRIFWEARQFLPEQERQAAGRSTSKEKAKNAEAAKEGFPGWTVLPKVRIDYYSLLPGAAKGYFDNIDPDARVLWRIHEGKAQIKVLSEFPARHPTMAKSFALAFFSMWAEVDKWNNWNPALAEAPKPIRPATLDYMTWEERVYIRFVKKEAGVGEMHRLFTPDGMIVQKTQSVSDPEDPRVKNLTTSGGYAKKVDQDRNYVIAVLGADKTVVVAHYECDLGDWTPPSMITNYILSWLMPTLIKKMFKTGADIFKDTAYIDRHTEDQQGFYARIAKCESCAVDRERTTGQKFHSSKPGHRIHSEITKSGDLWHRAQSFRSAA